MTEPFLQTLFPGRARICGRTLPPLTFWRLQCLLAVGSPFLSEEAETFTLADLLCALRVIRTPNLVAPDVRPSLRDLVTLVLHRRSRRYREKHGAAFQRYLALHQIRPEMWENEDSSTSRIITAPLILSQVVGLMDMGLRHHEAWDTAPGYASWLLAASAERHSDLSKFATEDDAIHARVLDQLDSELEQMNEDQVIALARAELPPEIFNQWLSARQESQQPFPT